MGVVEAKQGSQDIPAEQGLFSVEGISHWFHTHRSTATINFKRRNTVMQFTTTK